MKRLLDVVIWHASIASEVEPFVLNAVSDIRAYGLSYEEALLTASRKQGVRDSRRSVAGRPME